MRTWRAVVETPDFSVRVVSCTARHHAWSAPEEGATNGIVLVHRGMFRVRSDGHRVVADPTTGYVQAPGREYAFAHPSGGDVCTFIQVRPSLWQAVVADDAPGPSVAVDGRVELAHRMLLRTGEDAADPAERLVHALAAAVRPPGEPGSARGDLADRAREAILEDDPDAADLVRLAEALGVSPSHLSRTFRRHVGMTVSRYRNRVRVSRALARIEQGEGDLAALAAALGFADQAHLTRTVRAELGHPPGRLRRLFSGGTAGQDA
ncbi:helix-turn-helix domain-containing protein [Microbispora corallina]|uniref:helix-turn-helix domain-containing protein n=1 Tax=Microbispora corallina TaxID=83302 RepID=UPI0019528A72|nr:AraC family transcriptional regulator [Microbispora corallina]